MGGPTPSPTNQAPSPAQALAPALAEESRAQGRAEAYALKAQAEGEEAQAKLWRAVAQSHGVAVRRLTMLMRGKVGPPADNLARHFVQEIPRRGEAYAAMAGELRQAGLTGAAAALDQAAQVAQHEEALAPGGEPREANAYHVCQICGCTFADDPPENCPVCGAVAARITPVE